MSENVFIDLKDRSHVMSTEDEIPENGAKRGAPGPRRALRRLESLYI
jgi:hypothetical protein